MNKILGLGVGLIFVFLSCVTAPAIHEHPVWVSTPHSFRASETKQDANNVLPPQSFVTIPFHLVNLETNTIYHPQKNLPASRFMSQHFLDWQKIFSTGDLGKKIVLLQHLANLSHDFPENYWAAKFLYELYFQAHIPQEAQRWLKKAKEIYPNSEDSILLAWLQAFELDLDSEQIKKNFDEVDPQQLSPSGRMLYRMVRLKLNFYELSLPDIGLDPHVSDLETDQDDLWVATWDGGLARYSLPTQTWKVFWKPQTEVSPIKQLCVTKWFIYVFQDSVMSRYSKVTETWRTFPYPEGWGGLRVESVIPLDEQTLLVAHLGQGLWEWKAGVWNNLSQALPTPFLTALSPAKQGGWWIGTQDKGGGWLSENYQTFIPWAKGPKDVTFILDHQGFLYTGSYGQGLWVGESNNLVRLPEAPRYVVKGLLQPVVSKSDAKGSSVVLWGGTLDHGSFRWDGRTWTSYSSAEGFPFTDVTALAREGSYVLWGSMNDGLGAWLDRSP
ncbi:MAG: hypothetical protein HKM05_11050 [Spirochaetales bacterium]|nr:hypothetical protein [Spirochaetales bacterium]